jgi:hypothetical protein
MLGETLSHGPIVEKLEGGGTDGVDQAEDTAVPIENREDNCRPFCGWCVDLLPTTWVNPPFNFEQPCP